MGNFLNVCTCALVCLFSFCALGQRAGGSKQESSDVDTRSLESLVSAPGSGVNTGEVAQDDGGMGGHLSPSRKAELEAEREIEQGKIKKEQCVGMMDSSSNPLATYYKCMGDAYKSTENINGPRSGDPSKISTDKSKPEEKPPLPQCELTPAYDNLQKDLTARLNDCSESSESANSICNLDGNKEIAGVVNMASNLVVGMGIQLACTKMADVSQGLNGAVAAFKGSCGKIKSSCMSACSEVAQEATQAVKELKAEKTCDGSALAREFESMKSQARKDDNNCAGKERDIQTALGAVTNMVGTHVSAAKCKENTLNQTKTFCELTPSAPICSYGRNEVNCNDPAQAKSNPTCICAKDPRNSVCASLAGNDKDTLNKGEASSLDAGSDGIGEALKNASYGSSDPYAPGAKDLTGLPGNGAGQGRKTEALGAGASGGGLGGESGSGAAASRRGGAGGSKFEYNLGAGSGSSSGGRMGSGGRRGGGVAAEAEARRYAYNGNRAVAFKPFDLKGQMGAARRGPASCAAVAGIGCSQADIWKIMNSRYLEKRPGLDGW